MKTEFTEGRWHVFLDTIQTNNGGKIAEVCTENDTCKNNWEANAKLIAAAPELLEAVKITLNWIKTGQEFESSVKHSCEKAIKKATE